MAKLSAIKVKTAPPGVYPDGAGLYLCVTPSGARSWIYRFSWQGRRPEMGLGSLADVSLAEAREAAQEARRQVKAGTNPIEARRAAKLAGAVGKTFGDVADAFFKAKQAEYGNPKYREMTRIALTRTVANLRPLPVDAVDTAAIMSVLRPLWLETPKTARRVREKVEAVLDYAAVHGLRQGDNPSRWRGHLEHLLPSNTGSEGNHPALPYKDAPAFYAELRSKGGTLPLALEFLILTAARSGEARGARWDEINFAESLWTIPAARMKAKNAHTVPLPPRAVEILREMERQRDGYLIFPGSGKTGEIASQSLGALLDRMGLKGKASVHGFRSTFRDWAGDRTEFPREVAEAALAHRVGNVVEQAYRRGSALEKRRELMTAWENYLRGEK